MDVRKLLGASTMALIALINQAHAASANSQYAQIAADQYIGTTNVTVLSEVINLSTPSWVYLESDGRVYPYSGPALADIYITVDGAGASVSSIVDWSQSTDAQQHSYNAIGAVYLGSGAHTVALHMYSRNSYTFGVGAQSNLSAMISPATTVTVGALSADSAVQSFNVSSLSGTSPLPTNPLVTMTVNPSNGLPVVAMASERMYQSGTYGDPLTTITLDGANLPNNEASWSDNNLWTGAEFQAPFFTNGYFPSMVAGPHSLSISTSALPYSGDDVQFKMGAGSTLVALQGGMVAVGAATPSSAPYNVESYICIASNDGNTACPTSGTPTIIAQGDIVIPAGHNGVVLVTGKTRIQGDHSDAGGTVSLYLSIDGVNVGSDGVQVLGSPWSDSTRTMSTSYLATGANALAPGTHHVILYGKAVGSFANLCMTEDLPLVWFD